MSRGSWGQKGAWDQVDQSKGGLGNPRQSGMGRMGETSQLWGQTSALLKAVEVCHSFPMLLQATALQCSGLQAPRSWRSLKGTSLRGRNKPFPAVAGVLIQSISALSICPSRTGEVAGNERGLLLG